MLRCAGCDLIVSTWAARCPNCQRSTIDAIELPEEPPIVPAKPTVELDVPDPPDTANPPPRRTIPLLLAVVAIVAVTITVVTIIKAPSGSTPRPGLRVPSAVRALTGFVVAEAPEGTFFLSHPDGSHSATVPERPLAPGDHSLVVATGGEVIAVGQGPLSLPASATRARLLASGALAQNPLAEGGKAVVVTSSPSGPGFSSSVSVLRIGGGRAVPLGTANSAAGDPAALGAFISVAGALQPGEPGRGDHNVLADSRVELRDQDHTPVVLAGATALNRDVHEDPGRPVNLGLFPDHDGGKVAVVVNPVGAEESNAAVVILDRLGRVLGTVDSARGPIQYTPVYWSPDNTSLAFSSFDSLGVTLTIVDGRFQPTAQEFDTPTSVNGCTWSPDSSWVLCLATSPFVDNWVIARNDRSLTPIYSIPGRGVPVAWLP
jgi:hypothetical protein